MGNEGLAYVFWHWKRDEIEMEQYENRQRTFHRALSSARPPGFHHSFSVGISDAPWAAAGSPAYEDWYLVESFDALGKLNQGAVSASRTEPHDAAAVVAAGGAGGLYGLRGGTISTSPTLAYWFSKPEGMGYPELLGNLDAAVGEGEAAIWQRQMVLGPAPEFCIQALTPLSLPEELSPVVLSLRNIWPDSQD